MKDKKIKLIATEKHPTNLKIMEKQICNGYPVKRRFVILKKINKTVKLAQKDLK